MEIIYIGITNIIITTCILHLAVYHSFIKSPMFFKLTFLSINVLVLLSTLIFLSLISRYALLFKLDR